MSHRRYRVHPPASAEVTSGALCEFAPADDTANAGKPLPPPVELTPTGPGTEMVVFTPEDDHAADPPKEPSSEIR